MNNNEYEILQLIKNQRIENQRTLAKMSNFSLGKVNRLINKLIMEGFLTSDWPLQVQVKDYLKNIG